MIGFKKTALVVLLAGMGFNGTSQAALIARTGGMVYDDVNNITWAADANLFKTQAAGNANLVNEIIVANGGVIHNTANQYDGYTGIYNLTSYDFNTGNGRMNWWGAQAWVNNLTLGDVNGWSLPGTLVEYGYALTSSPMVDLLYKQLGVVGGYNFETIHNANYNLFTNIQNNAYWSGREHSDPNLAWAFFTFDAQSYSTTKPDHYYAWAVHSGDVAAVPVPGAVWLFSSGLIGLLSFTRRKNKAANLIAA